MEKVKAIPKGFMTVGELAKKIGVTVRTLQYYDKEGLLAPSAESEGGRRLYTDKDLIRLHQILSLKHLGFSLDDIKTNLVSLDTPEQVAKALEKQATAIKEKMQSLSESLREIEALQSEVLKMQTVDFKKYADIIVNLQMKNEYYWMIKNFDDQTLEHFHKRFNKDSGLEMMETFQRLTKEALRMKAEHVSPSSEIAIEFAKEFWNMIMEFTGGDMTILSKLVNTDYGNGADSEWTKNQAMANSFIEPALDAYFTKCGVNPFEEGLK